MAGKKITPEKQALLTDIEQFVVAVLTHDPVVRLPDLDQQVYAEFAERIKSLDLEVPLRSGRTEWANLVDWAKANMTKRGWTRYFDVGKDNYLTYLPPSGQVNGVRLVDYADATRLRDALIRLIKAT